MTVRVDDEWSYSGLPVIRVENAALAVDVVPSMGGKLLHLVDKAGDRNVLWRNPRVRVRPGPLQADVDDWFAGGWDDAFPTGDACENQYGERLPYMGELWNLALRAHVERAGPDEAVIVLDGQTPITPARWTRTITLRAGEPLLRLRTRIENVGYRPFAFSWGSHPALAVHEGMRIDVPAARGEVTDATTGSGPLGALGQTYDYPLVRTDREPAGAGKESAFDVRAVPTPTLGHTALHALTGLSAGWIAATDPVARRGFGVSFDAELHRCVWQWMAYGGFRGWYHAIVEPWTAPQPALADARRAGTALSLAPGEALESEMTAVLYGGVAHVSSLGADGAVA